MRWFLAIILSLIVTVVHAQDKRLNECMDSHYGPGNWTQRTGVGSGTDIGPAMTACLQQIKNTTGRGRLVIPPGIWLMTNPPPAGLISGIQVEGYGSQASLVVLNNQCLPLGNSPFWWTGAGGYTGGGMRGVGLLLEQGLGDTSCYGIILRGDSVSQPDQVGFDDIYLSAIGGSSYWYVNLLIDGNARVAPKGMRVGTFTNMQLFNSWNVTGYVGNGVSLIFTGIGCWTGKQVPNGPAPNQFIIDPNSVQISLRAIWCSNLNVQ